MEPLTGDHADNSPIDMSWLSEYDTWDMGTLRDELTAKRRTLEARREALAQKIHFARSEQQRIDETIEHIDALIGHEDAAAFVTNLREQWAEDWSKVSVPEAVEKALGLFGQPMHADEILNELERHGKKVGKDNVVTACVRAMRRGTVVRVDKNTYQLASELERQEEVAKARETPVTE